MPSEIEFVAGRKRVKLGSVPSHFCMCSSENQKNCSRNSRENHTYNERKRQINSVQKAQIIDTLVENHCEYITSDQQTRLTPLNINNTSNGKTCLKIKRRMLDKHQCGCVQTYKPLTKEVQSSANSQEVVEQIDEMQTVDKNIDLLRSITDENKQLRNEMKRIVEEVVKVTKKTEENDVEIYTKKL